MPVQSGRRFNLPARRRLLKRILFTMTFSAIMAADGSGL
jgi:hypothetical protein